MLRKRIYFFRVLIGAFSILLLGMGIALAQEVPAPEEILKIKVGADYQLQTTIRLSSISEPWRRLLRG